MLSDAEFSRSIALAIIYPVLRPRYCPCGQPIDPAAFHLLHCHFNHYGDLHDCVKRAVELRLRSFMSDEAASFSVLVEKPLSSFFGRRCPSTALNESEGIADLIISMHASLQQFPVAVDFVSCFPHKNSSYKVALQERARFKRRKYASFLFPDNSFYPLPFGRTNVLADDVFAFCTFIGNFLPKNMRADAKLRATFSRAIYAGTARLHNLARRMQLSAAQRLPLSSFSFSSLLDPYALEHSDRSSRRDPRWTAFTDASLTAGLAAALARPDSVVVQGGMERRWQSSLRRGAEGRGA
jgi:hypothetical protein